MTQEKLFEEKPDELLGIDWDQTNPFRRRPRQTSKDAYKAIVIDGGLNGMQAETYGILYDFGPMTQAMAVKIWRKRTGSESSAPQKRFQELKKMGVIQEVGVEACAVSGRKVIWWDVTARLPRKSDISMRRDAKKRIWDNAYAMVQAWRKNHSQDRKIKILQQLEEDFRIMGEGGNAYQA